ncbi:(2Fe-2S)-binding protein [Herbiconiux solani]|uniref:(2Fe-2S)-binding protein n=1 Tax=Herbiconiux solani TaxID=661329 RepID=UPI00082431DF|nr:(2Fe-2S)-binding protein [Herbiconiux solani]
MPETPPFVLRINGVDRSVAPDPRTTVLDALREQLQLTGTKKGCDHGQCGACTIHVDGEPRLACLTLAVMADGRDIRTIEGLQDADADGDSPADSSAPLHPVQAAFIEHDAFQCGYCTSGQIMSAVACIRQGRTSSSGEIQEFMSGNLCRCAAYPNIIAAIEDVAADQASSPQGGIPAA